MCLCRCRCCFAGCSSPGNTVAFFKNKILATIQRRCSCMQEFEEYYEMKHGKKPVFVRRLTKDESDKTAGPPPAAPSSRSKLKHTKRFIDCIALRSLALHSLFSYFSFSSPTTLPAAAAAVEATAAAAGGDGSPMGIAGKQVKLAPSTTTASAASPDDFFEERCV